MTDHDTPRHRIVTRPHRLSALAVAVALVASACGGDDSDVTGSSDAGTTVVPSEAPALPAEADDTTAPNESSPLASEPDVTTAPSVSDLVEDEPEGWTVDTDLCVDAADATAPIEDTVHIGSAMPITGGVAAAAFAPLREGFAAYIDYANQNGLLPGYTIELSIEDDQFNAELTPGAIQSQIDAGADLFSGIVGTPNNLAVRDQLNDECYPTLNAVTGSPAWGEVEDYPWTTGYLVPYMIEAQIYAAEIADQFPDGATASLFYVNAELGQIHRDAFTEAAAAHGIEIVGEQTIDPTDANPPTSQVTTLAEQGADVVMAVPLGAGCIGFLNEMAKAKAQNPEWTPLTFLTNTCASSLILGAAGAAADGLYSSGNIMELTDPANASVPAVAEYLAFMEARGSSAVAETAGTGWTVAEITVAVLRQAAESPDGLTRVSIIEAARNFSLMPSLARPGVEFRLDGERRRYLAESLQVLQYDADTQTFAEIGELNTAFEN